MFSCDVADLLTGQSFSKNVARDDPFLDFVRSFVNFRDLAVPVNFFDAVMRSVCSQIPGVPITFKNSSKSKRHAAHVLKTRDHVVATLHRNGFGNAPGQDQAAGGNHFSTPGEMLG